MREIALDTETTGLDPNHGHRVVEIGCVEMINRVRTGAVYHIYLNPERDMPADAFAIHGISSEFLQDKPLFAAEVDAFLAFIGEAPLVIHNAAFDMKFINAELRWASRKPLPMSQAVDTLKIARRKFGHAPASLDALCKRFNVDGSARTLHGALLDAELLADVYLELMGGRQDALFGAEKTQERVTSGQTGAVPVTRPYREPRPHAPSEAERAAHHAFLAQLTNPMWEWVG